MQTVFGYLYDFFYHRDCDASPFGPNTPGVLEKLSHYNANKGPLRQELSKEPFVTLKYVDGVKVYGIVASVNAIMAMILVHVWLQTLGKKEPRRVCLFPAG